MGEGLVLLWLAALPLMGSPGPAAISVAGIGAVFGTRKGLPYLGGIGLGTADVLVIVGSGVTGLILAQPALLHVLTAIAFAYIAYLAWKIGTAPPLGGTGNAAPAPGFASGFVLAIANPKAFAAIGAVYSGHTVVETALLADALAKIAALAAVIVIVNGAWLVLGSSISAILSDRRLGRVANVTFALMLIASVAFAVLA